MHRHPSPLAALALPLLAAAAAAQVDPADLGPLAPRSIGPAGMSGRVAAIEGLASDPAVLYVGAATGGLWRSTDGGLTFEPLFDDQPVASIGAVAVHPARPEELWVGTGEGNPRNSSSVGNGVYRSLDGGRSWAHVGLERTEKIARLRLHPGDARVAYVAALGTSWGENPERGVFKTRDGGASWERVLYVDERTGCADLAMDPGNPDKLIAAMWDHRREPHFFRSGGPGSGLYMTRDGGASWKRLGEAEGLPAGELGRIGVAFAPSDPRVVYALVEAQDNVLLRSDDGGASFRVVNRERDIAPRPFYYADLRVDPQDPDRVYNLHSVVTVSDDGGQSFRTLAGWDVHPDHHAMWIDPRDPHRIVDGNDGGVAISNDRGGTWRFVTTLPLAQYYHVAVDMERPYNVYGGMQDNGSWRGPSSVWENGGVRNHHWVEVGFGDGFATLAIPGDDRYGYAMSQGGALFRWDLATGERMNIRPDAPAGEELRFNWNAGIAICPFHPDTVYYGSQYLHVSHDRGESWRVLSPDLTTDDPDWQRQAESGGLTRDVTAAENYCSILTIAPSPLEHDTLWVGSDDGRIHVTTDGGASWTSVEGNVLGVPEHTWVPHLEASKHDTATCYAVFDDHRRANGATYVYRTRDLGRTWTPLSTEGVRGYAHVVEEDPLDPDLLFLGTELGLYVSIDGGRKWTQWTAGFPTVAVRALVVHPREHDLVVGTHGRAAWVIDDVSPLRALSPEVLAEPVHLFDVQPSQQHRVAQTGASRFPGHGEFRGATRPYGALITFSLNAEAARALATEAEGDDAGSEAGEDEAAQDPELEIRVLDADGEHLRTLEHEARDGLNRVVWDLRRKGFRRSGPPVSEDELPAGPEVPPGTYIVEVRYGDALATAPVEVLGDPRVELSPEDWRAKWDALRELGLMGERAADLELALDRALEDLALVEKLAARAKPLDEDAEHPHQDLLDAAKELKDALEELARAVRGDPDAKGIVRDDDTLRSKLGGAGWGLGSSWSAPTPAQLARLVEARAALAAFEEQAAPVLGERLAAFRAQFAASGLGLFAGVEPGPAR